MSSKDSEKIRIIRPNFAKRSTKKKVLNVSRIVPYLVRNWERKVEEKPMIMETKEVLDLVKVNLRYPIVSLHQIEHLKYFLGPHFAAYLRKVSDAMAIHNEKVYKAREKYQEKLLLISRNNQAEQKSTN